METTQEGNPDNKNWKPQKLPDNFIPRDIASTSALPQANMPIVLEKHQEQYAQIYKTNNNLAHIHNMGHKYGGIGHGLLLNNYNLNHHGTHTPEAIDLTYTSASGIKLENYQAENCAISVQQKVPYGVSSNMYYNKHFINNKRKKQKLSTENNLERELQLPRLCTNLERDGELQLPRLSTNLLRHINCSDYLKVMDNKQQEIIKAAKSLFSKRTRTLYHWMYPNAPKTQLKTAISASWDTLGMQEKEFYISQVLGRFGFPQSNLMVNPQLDGIKDLNTIAVGASLCNLQNGEETSNAVSNLLMSENHPTGQHWLAATTSSDRPPLHTQRVNRKTRKIGRPQGSKNRKHSTDEYPRLVPAKQSQNEIGEDEFEDDPELSRELQQFRWSLNFTD